MVNRYTKFLESYWGIQGIASDLPAKVCDLVKENPDRSISKRELYREIKDQLKEEDQKLVLLSMLQSELGTTDKISNWQSNNLENLLSEIEEGSTELLSAIPEYCSTLDNGSPSLIQELQRYGLAGIFAQDLNRECLQVYCGGVKTYTNLVRAALSTARTEKERKTAEYMLLLAIRNYLASHGHNFEFLGSEHLSVVQWSSVELIHWTGKIQQHQKVPVGHEITFHLGNDNLVVLDNNQRQVGKAILSPGKKIHIQMDSPGIHRFGSTTCGTLSLVLEVVDPTCIGIILPQLPEGLCYNVDFLHECRKWILADQKLKKIESQVLHGEPISGRCNVIRENPPILLREDIDPEDAIIRAAESLEDQSLSDAISEHLEEHISKKLEKDPIALQTFKVWHAISGAESLQMMLASYENTQMSEEKLLRNISSQLTDPTKKDKLLKMLRSQFYVE